MRNLFAAATLFAGLCLLAPGQASAVAAASGEPCRNKQGARRVIDGGGARQADLRPPQDR